MKPQETNASFCPGCERFIGPARVCPYCDADSARSPILAKLQYSALALGIIGLLFLYLAVTNRERATVKIGYLSPTMNFAYVQVKGTVDRDPYIGKKKDLPDFVAFSVSDDTGQLQIAAYRDTARTLIEGHLLPGKGDSVEVSGVLNLSADGKTRLRLQSPQQLRITANRSTEQQPENP